MGRVKNYDASKKHAETVGICDCSPHRIADKVTDGFQGIDRARTRKINRGFRNDDLLPCFGISKTVSPCRFAGENRRGAGLRNNRSSLNERIDNADECPRDPNPPARSPSTIETEPAANRETPPQDDFCWIRRLFCGRWRVKWHFDRLPDHPQVQPRKPGFQVGTSHGREGLR